MGPSGLLAGDAGPLPSAPCGDAALGKLANAIFLAARPGSARRVRRCVPHSAQAQATLYRPASPDAATALLFDGLGRTLRLYSGPAHAGAISLDRAGLAPGPCVVCGGAACRLVVE